MNFFLKSRRPPGFTLVEIMVSMIIALIVMGGVYRTLADESIDHERSEMILDMQNNARMAMGRLIKDVRRAGFLGCGGELAANTLTNAGTDATFISRLTVARAPVLPADPPGMVRNMAKTTILDQLTDPAAPVAFDYLGEALGFADNAPADHLLYEGGTDALTLVFLSDERMVNNLTPMTSGTTVPITLNRGGFAVGDILLITDCQDYSLFQKTAEVDNDSTVERAIGGLLNNNVSDDLKKDYGQSALARVFKLNTSTYFIEKGNFTLAHDDVNDSRAIASNIEDLQFEFLFDRTCDGIPCLDGDGVLTEETWQTTLAGTSKEVRAIRIWVLAMSEPDFGYTDNNFYVYPNSLYPDAAHSPAAQAPITSPSDGEHRHRYLASAVVYLRNAGIGTN